MKIFDRILCVVTALLLFCVCLCVGAAAWGWPLSVADWTSVVEMVSDGTIALVAGISALLAALLCLRVIFAPKKQRAPAQPASALIQTTDIGCTYIAISALEAMALRHVRTNNRVRDCSATIRVVEGGSIVFGVKLSALPETPLVELTTELQNSLKEYVESQSGIQVQEVSILVEGVSSAALPSRID